MPWQPTTIKRFIHGIPSSARTALVATDAGQGYLKAMGGPEGEHTLAAELVATRLAQWFGLSTFDLAIVVVDVLDEIPFMDRDGNQTGQAKYGPAFITRGESGDSWSGDERQLAKLVNPQDVARLVVFDTWLLNCDRHSWPQGNPPRPARINRNNVFLSEVAPPGQFVLKAMDHTHCFTCGRPWTNRLAAIDNVKDGRLFGLFPEFRAFLGEDRLAIQQAVRDLRSIDRKKVIDCMQGIPKEWGVPQAALDALVELVVNRATFVAETIESKIWPQRDLDFRTVEETEHNS
jgi:hypothetical protein